MLIKYTDGYIGYGNEHTSTNIGNDIGKYQEDLNCYNLIVFVSKWFFISHVHCVNDLFFVKGDMLIVLEPVRLGAGIAFMVI